MKSQISHSLEETKKIAAEWVADISSQALPSREVEAGDNASAEGATVVGLSGHLGSGKTTFVQAMAESLGIKEFITSPTFVIMKIYPIDSDPNSKKQKWSKLIHIDAYRLENGKEMQVLDFEKLVSGLSNLILIEWPENVKEGLPENVAMIKFEAIGDNERRIQFE